MSRQRQRFVAVSGDLKAHILASGVSADQLITNALDAAGAPPFEPAPDAHLVPISVSARIRNLLRERDPFCNRGPLLDAAINATLDALGAP